MEKSKVRKALFIIILLLFGRYLTLNVSPILQCMNLKQRQNRAFRVLKLITFLQRLTFNNYFISSLLR